MHKSTSVPLDSKSAYIVQVQLIGLGDRPLSVKKNIRPAWQHIFSNKRCITDAFLEPKPFIQNFGPLIFTARSTSLRDAHAAVGNSYEIIRAQKTMTVGRVGRDTFPGMPRLRILSPAEQTAFTTPPVFNAAGRKLFFEIPGALLGSFATPANSAYFLVALAYFRAAGRFFPIPFRKADIDYAAAKLGMTGPVDPLSYKESTYRRHRKIILQFLGVRPFDRLAEDTVRRAVSGMVRSQARPKLILAEAVTMLENKKTEIPAIRVLVDVIADEISRHGEQLAEVIDKRLSASGKELLDSLLEKQAGGGDGDPERGGESPAGRYRLTLLKKISQSTRPAQIRMTVADFRTVRMLYDALEPVITALDLTPEGVRYYAHSVLKFEIFQLARRSRQLRYLHLVCFIAHQYFRLHDTLADVLLSCTQTAVNASSREHKERCFAERKAERQTIKSFVSSAAARVLRKITRRQEDELRTSSKACLL